MKRDNERTAAGGILHDLDDIRSLLDDAESDDAIPVLNDAVSVAEVASPSRETRAGADATEPALDEDELALIPILDDPIAADEAEDEDDEPGIAAPAWNVATAAAAATSIAHELVPHAKTTAELLAVEELKLAIRHRIDATLKRWVNESLEREMTLLRARLLEVVHDEVHGYLASRIDRGDSNSGAVDSAGIAESGRASALGDDDGE